MSVLETGYLSVEELKKSPNYPTDKRLEMGACVVIECVQDIPCNPCETVCPQGAIIVGNPITNLPVFNENACTGCGLCISICPGQAIFLVDRTYSETEALVAFPFEYLPLPEKGETVNAVNRAGKVITQGKVVRIFNPKKNDRTPVVYIAVEKRFADEVRSIQHRALLEDC